MSEKEIKDLAREYAESATIGLEPHDIEEQRRIEYDFALPVLEWLSSRYCIVEKSKILSEYKKSYSQSFEPTTCLDRQYARGRYQVLRELFGKELFNEDKQ